MIRFCTFMNAFFPLVFIQYDLPSHLLRDTVAVEAQSHSLKSLRKQVGESGRLHMASARIEKIAEMLEFCREPKRKGWIEAMLDLNEVFSQSYLTICTSQKLLDLRADNSYITTEKGRRFLRTYSSFSDVVRKPLLTRV